MLTQLSTTEAHEDGVMCLAICGSGETLCVLSGGCDGVINVISRGGEIVQTIQGHKAGDTCNRIIEVSPGYVLSCGDDGAIHMYSLKDQRLTKLATANQGSAVNHILFHAQAGVLCACDDNGGIAALRLPSFVMDTTLPVEDPSIEKIISFNGGAQSLNCMAQHDTLLWTGGDDGYIRVWSITDDVLAVASAEEASQVLPSNNILVVQTEDEVMVNVLSVHSSILWAGIGMSGVGVIQKRSAATGELLCSVVTSDWVRAITFLRPGEGVSAYDDGKVCYFNGEKKAIEAEAEVAETAAGEEGEGAPAAVDSDNEEEPAPVMVEALQWPRVALMDLTVGQGLVAVTKDTDVVLFEVAE